MAATAIPEALLWPSVRDVCASCGISQGYVSQLIKAGRLYAVKTRLDWLLNPESVAAFQAAREAHWRERERSA